MGVLLPLVVVRGVGLSGLPADATDRGAGFGLVGREDNLFISKHRPFLEPFPFLRTIKAASVIRLYYPRFRGDVLAS